MPKYDTKITSKARRLRSQGFTYTEIQKELSVKIPKSSLSYICRGIVLSPAQQKRIEDQMKPVLASNRQKAVIANRDIHLAKVQSYKVANNKIRKLMQSRNTKLVALAMLYLGEGAKWRSRRGLMLGSADPLILSLYIKLLEDCYGIKKDSLRGRIQHRADQNYVALLSFWSKATGINKKNFYPGYIDKRTIGKPTLKKDYRGVCVVTCAGTHVQLELEQIAGIINEAIAGI